MEMEEMDLREYWEIIVKKRLLIGTIFFVTVLAVTVYSLVATPIYEATTTVMVRDQSAASPMAMFDSMGGMGKNTAQNYIQIMKSRLILSEVATLMNQPDLDPKLLEKKITIQPIQGSDVLKISMQSPEPGEAQDFINTLTSVFIEWNRLYQQEDRRSARFFIESQLESVSKNLTLAEEELRIYREKERVLSPSQQTIAGIEQLASLETSLSQVQIGKTEALERLEQVRMKLAKQEETLISTTTIGDNLFVVEYRARLADLEIALSGAKEKYTDRHPSVLALQAEIDDVKDKLTEHVERVVGTETRSLNPVHQELYASVISLEVELMALDAREMALKNLIAEAEMKLSSLPAKELELARLMRDAKVLEELYIMLRTKNEETKIAEVMQTADVQVIDRAILPEIPVKPRVKLNIAIGAVLGMFLGVGVAFLVEFMDTTLKTKEDAEKLLGIPVLGQIPDFNLVDQDQKQRGFFGK